MDRLGSRDPISPFESTTSRDLMNRGLLIRGVPNTRPRSLLLGEKMRRINPDRPLTQAERNKRFYENHKEAAAARNVEYHQRNKAHVNRRVRNHRHRLTQEQYDAKMASQDNRCAICHKEFEGTPHVDHSHACCPPLRSCDKCRRGLLCEDCNLGLGRFKDSIVSLSNAIEYLKGYKQ